MPSHNAKSPEEIAAWRADVANGLNKKEIAAKYGAGYATVKRHLADCQPPPVPPEALANWEAALDEGYAYKHVGEMYGVHPETVRKYFPGRGWTGEQMREHSRLIRQFNRSKALC